MCPSRVVSKQLDVVAKHVTAVDEGLSDVKEAVQNALIELIKAIKDSGLLVYRSYCDIIKQRQEKLTDLNKEISSTLEAVNNNLLLAENFCSKGTKLTRVKMER